MRWWIVVAVLAGCYAPQSPDLGGSDPPAPDARPVLGDGSAGKPGDGGMGAECMADGFDATELDPKVWTKVHDLGESTIVGHELTLVPVKNATYPDNAEEVSSIASFPWHQGVELEARVHLQELDGSAIDEAIVVSLVNDDGTYSISFGQLANGATTQIYAPMLVSNLPMEAAYTDGTDYSSNKQFYRVMLVADGTVEMDYSQDQSNWIAAATADVPFPEGNYTVHLDAHVVGSSSNVLPGTFAKLSVQGTACDP